MPMTGRTLRTLFWALLALLIVAQSGANEPESPPAAPALPTEQVQTTDALHPENPQADADESEQVDLSTSTPAQMPSSNIVIPSGANIAVIPISGLIYDFTLESLERRVDKAIDGGASLIVIELDTPGGVVTSALKMSKYIKGLSVPTVAWVHNEAYSAGIMIAASCDEIVMSPSSATGDCAPIVPGMNLDPTERAKALSPILEEFRDSAQVNGYDYAMFHAMCVLGVELYMVEKNDGSGERMLVNKVDYAVMVNGESPQDQPSSTPSLPSATGTSLPDVKDVGAVTLSVATSADRGVWHAVEELPSGAKIPDGRVHDGKTLLTLNQTRALDVGLSKQTVATESAIKSRYNAANIVTITPTWSEGVAAILTSWWMRIILIVVFLVGAFLEMQAPGLSLPGGVAIVALGLLIGAPFVIGLAEVWHILMFIIGFVLVIIELVMMPTFGILGVVGLMMMFVGIVLSVVPSGPGWLPPPEMQRVMMHSIFATTVGLIISGIGFFYITKHFGSIPGLNRLILNHVQPSAATVGVDAAGNPIKVSGDEVLGVGLVEVGSEGKALTDLRPTGVADFDGNQIDVVTVGSYIEQGERVKIVELQRYRIVVDKA